MAKKDKNNTTEKLTQKPTPKKSKFIGKVVREFKKKGVTHKIGETYDAIQKDSLEYLINAGYLV